MISPATYQTIVSGQRRDPLAVLARWGLRLAEFPYHCVTAIRNRRYDRGRLPVTRVEVPVISVGNLTVGGTGKTPLVAWLARWFRQQGVRVSLISRGYGATDGSRNDEAKELEARLPDVPHLQHPDRVAAARIAIDELETQLIILDDAFQHRRLARDLDVVLIDATEPFGYGHLLPRGLLRESVRGLRRADVVALTRCDLISDSRRQQLRQHVQSLAPQATWVEIAQQPTTLLAASGRSQSLAEISRGPILAFCGIGNPAAFWQTLEQLGFTIRDRKTFPDHHAYDAATVTSLREWASRPGDAERVLCTHKDLVKLATDRLGHLPLAALQVDLQLLAGADALQLKLHELLRRVPTE